MLRKLIDLQYSRNDIDFKRGTFRVRGDVVELHPTYEEFAYRIEFFGDEITTSTRSTRSPASCSSSEEQVFIYPAVHYVMPEDRLQGAVQIDPRRARHAASCSSAAKASCSKRSVCLPARNTTWKCCWRSATARASKITRRHLDGRKPGEKPYTLIDYFPKDYLLIIDESHVTIPQLKAMYFGDRNRKEVLVEHGFRLPSAMDNRPLKYEEFEQMWNQVVFVSATPGKIELEKTGGEVVEQVIRPTGLVDPEIEVHPAQGQVPHLLTAIKERTAAGERVLVTTLTKRLAEDLSAYIQEAGIRGRYLHSEIQTLERVEILQDLRKGDFDVLVGINLLREGLDLARSVDGRDPRRRQSRISAQRNQPDPDDRPGRAKRQREGHPLCRHNHAGDAEGDRRNHAPPTSCRLKYNADHGIMPETIKKAIRATLESEVKARQTVQEAIHANEQQIRPDGDRQAARGRDAPGRAEPRIRAGGAAARQDQRDQGRPDDSQRRPARRCRGKRPAAKIWQPKNQGRPKRRMAK